MSRNKVYPYDNRLKIYGSTHEIGKAEEIIERFYPDLKDQKEGDARINLQSILDTEPIHATLLFNGNHVYGMNKILKDIKSVKKNGMHKMTNRLYEFLNLCCGSIAHYNKQGWIAEYPTVKDLRAFFKCNEFGVRVIQHVSNWNTDVKAIVTEIENILCI